MKVNREKRKLPQDNLLTDHARTVSSFIQKYSPVFLCIDGIYELLERFSAFLCAFVNTCVQ